jgi:outer membrane protein assembly factor BamB
VIPAIANQSSEDEWPMFHHDPRRTGYAPSTAPSTNEILWTYQTGGFVEDSSNINVFRVESSPAIVDGRVYVGSNDNNLYCLDADTGQKIWHYTTAGKVTGSPAVVDGRVYIGDMCIDADTGEKIWGAEYGGGSPAVVDGRIYSDGYCYDTDAGEIIWIYTGGSSTSSTPAVADGRVYYGPLCLNADTG